MSKSIEQHERDIIAKLEKISKNKERYINIKDKNGEVSIDAQGNLIDLTVLIFGALHEIENVAYKEKGKEGAAAITRLIDQTYGIYKELRNDYE